MWDMKSVFYIFLLLFFSCADRDPLPPGIEGTWRRLIPVHPPVEYSLHNGILVQTTFAAGVPVASIERVYVLQGDTLLRIGGAVGDPERIWRYRLIGPEAAEVYETGAPLGAYIILERL